MIIPFKWTVSEMAFGLDMNQLLIANGWAALFAPVNAFTVTLLSLCWLKDTHGVVQARIDFSPDPPSILSFAEALPAVGPNALYNRGNNINMRVTQQVDGFEAELYAQIKAWFGLPQSGTSYPVAVGLSTWAAPTNAGYQGRGGQTYPKTSRGTVLIAPEPANWFRT